MTYAKLNDVKAGTKLITDGGFTCMRAGEVKTVLQLSDGALTIPCRCGRHDLSGQIEGDHYVGLHVYDPTDSIQNSLVFAAEQTAKFSDELAVLRVEVMSLKCKLAVEKVWVTELEEKIEGMIQDAAGASI